MTAARGPLWPAVAVAAVAAAAVAAFGAWMTDLSPWYYALREPSWKPPDWLFGPAWTLIFALCAMAGVIAWRRAPSQRERFLLVALYAVNINLNILWSGVFFRLQRPEFALVEVAFLWLSILALIFALRRYAPNAAWLLTPYLAWVTFAAGLNYAVVQLNAPFHGA